MLRNMNIKAHMCVVGAASGGEPANRILRHVMVPTPSKLQIEKNPYITKGFVVPMTIAEEAAKSMKSLWNCPASADEIPNIDTSAD